MRYDVLTRVTGSLKIRVLKIISEFMYVSRKYLEELHTSTLKMEATGSSELFMLSTI
jgi:ATP phosphoribosyltransferase